MKTIENIVAGTKGILSTALYVGIAGLALAGNGCASDVDPLTLKPGVYEYDTNNDGKMDRRVTMEDYNADGKLDYVRTSEYDALGKSIKETLDSNADGKPDEVRTFVYNAQGNRIKEINDYNRDGTPDDVRTFEYDAQGNPQIKARSDLHHYDAKGKLDYILTFEYDAQGNLIKKIYDCGADGKPDSVVTYETANLITITISGAYDCDADGIPDHEKTPTPSTGWVEQ